MLLKMNHKKVKLKEFLALRMRQTVFRTKFTEITTLTGILPLAYS